MCNAVGKSLQIGKVCCLSLQVLKNSSEMYSEKDLYVGKVLSVHQRTFELLEADEFTYQYMENNRHVYLMADWDAALKAIQAQLQGTALDCTQSVEFGSSNRFLAFAVLISLCLKLKVCTPMHNRSPLFACWFSSYVNVIIFMQ